MSKPRKKRMPKRVLALPDLEQVKSAVLNTLTSVSGQRTYDHAINGFVECVPRSDRVRTALSSRRWAGGARTTAQKATQSRMPVPLFGYGLRLDQGADLGDEVGQGLGALIGVFAIADGDQTVLLFAVAHYQHVGDLL